MMEVTTLIKHNISLHMLDIPAYVMWRASDDVLKQRRVVKATKLSHKTPPPKADDDIIKQRKIVKVKRRTSTGSSSTDKLSTTTSSRSNPNSPQRDETPNVPSPLTPPPPQVSKSSANTSTSPAPPQTQPDTDEVLLLRMRATLFTRADRTWAKKAKGTLHVYEAKSNSKIRWIELKNSDNECILNLLVEQMINLHKLVKESTKGTCAYIKYSVEKRKSTETSLLQVMPENLDKLYSTLICEVDK